MSETYDLSQLEDIDLAAAEYALGSLDASEKAQFEALLAVSHDTQTKVAHWQNLVQQGLHDFAPLKAPKELWPKIALQLGHQSPWRNWLGNLRLWQGLSASTLALSALLVFNQWPTAAPLVTHIASTASHSPDLNYVMYNQERNPAWIVNASLANNQFSIDTIAPDPMASNKVCELWLVLDSGEPISLGILPKQGRMQVGFNTDITALENWQSLLKNATLVVSVESMTGAASGYDMGPVLDKGPWVATANSPVNGI